MKKFFSILICAVAIVSIVFNVVQTNSKLRISDAIANSILQNTHKLSSVYESMYLKGEPNEYFEFSLYYSDDICDSIKEEVSFYNELYPKRDMLINHLIDDYKLLIRAMKDNPNLIKDGQLLHTELQKYILEYTNDNIHYKGNLTKALYNTDRRVKTDDNGKWYLLHDKIVKLSKK